MVITKKRMRYQMLNQTLLSGECMTEQSEYRARLSKPILIF